eukprot:10760886-Heterocapsa_arctica.AAC.1
MRLHSLWSSRYIDIDDLGSDTAMRLIMQTLGNEHAKMDIGVVGISLVNPWRQPDCKHRARMEKGTALAIRTLGPTCR